MNLVPVSQFKEATAFLDFIRERIGHAPDAINQTGKIQRFSTNSKRGNLSGWCIWYGKAGACGNWRTGESHTWRSDQYQRLTKTERQRIDRQIRQAEARRKRELEAGYQQVAKQASEDIKRFYPATADHPYLLEKGILPHGALIDGQNVLIITMYYKGKIVSYQRIYPMRLPDGTNKRFLKGGRKKGCYHPIGNKGKGDLGICEGFATGASIHEATGDDVVVAFDAGNLLPVAKAMRDKYPDRKIILWADDDYRRVDRNGQPENIGVIKATEAAQAINGYLTVPDFGEKRPEGATDFNDLSQMMKGGKA
jgi:putative DNA primase/helicase